MRRLKKKARLIITITAAGAGGVALAVFASKLSSPITFVSNAPEAELGSIYDPADNIRSVFMGDKKDVSIEGEVNTESPGKYPVTYSINNHTQKITVTVSDTRRPELVLRDLVVDSNDEVDAESFVISVNDASKIQLSIKNEELLNFKDGTRAVTIIAMDEYGNKSSQSARLTRMDKSQAPVFSTEPMERTFIQGQAFEPLDITATDIDGNNVEVTVDASQLNMGIPGSYPVYYKAVDSEKRMNAACETIIVLPLTQKELPAQKQGSTSDSES